MGDRNRGVYHKFSVERTDGKSAPGQKHHDCFYFVLDCDHDPHAMAALRAYEQSCRAEYPALADDICNMLVERDFGGARPVAPSVCPACEGNPTGTNDPCLICDRTSQETSVAEELRRDRERMCADET